MSSILLRLKLLVKPLKLHEYSIRRGKVNPKKHLSEFGSTVFDLMEDCDFWVVGSHTLNHATGLQLWMSNGQSYFDIYKMPGDAVSTGLLSEVDKFILWKQADRLRKFLQYEDKRAATEHFKKMKM